MWKTGNRRRRSVAHPKNTLVRGLRRSPREDRPEKNVKIGLERVVSLKKVPATWGRTVCQPGHLVATAEKGRREQESEEGGVTSSVRASQQIETEQCMSTLEWKKQTIKVE